MFLNKKGNSSFDRLKSAKQERTDSNTQQQQQEKQTTPTKNTSTSTTPADPLTIPTDNSTISSAISSQSSIPSSQPTKTKQIAHPITLVASKSSIFSSKTSLMKLFNINNQKSNSLTKNSNTNSLNRPPNLFYLNDQSHDSDVAEVQGLYDSWDLETGYGRNLDSWELSCGLQDWSKWRTKINDYLILTSMFSSLNEFLSHQKNSDFKNLGEKEEEETPLNFDLMKNFKVEPSLARFIYYYGLTFDSPELTPDSYMFYGIPRARLPGSGRGQLAISKDKKPAEKALTRPGISVKEKVRVFEGKSNNAMSSKKTEAAKERKKNVTSDSLEHTGKFRKNLQRVKVLLIFYKLMLANLDTSLNNQASTQQSYLVLAESSEIKQEQPANSFNKTNNNSIVRSSTLREKARLFKQILLSSRSPQNKPEAELVQQVKLTVPASVNEASKVAKVRTKKTKPTAVTGSRNYHTRYYCPKHKRFHHDLVRHKCSSSNSSNRIDMDDSSLSTVNKPAKEQRVRSRIGAESNRTKRKSVRKVFDILAKSSDTDGEVREFKRTRSHTKYSQTSPVNGERPSKISIQLDLSQVDLEINKKQVTEFKISSPSEPSIISQDNVRPIN